MDPNFIRRIRERCDCDASDFELANNILNDINQRVDEYLSQANDFNEKMEKAVEVIHSYESILTEVEERYNEELLNFNNLQRELAEKNKSTMKLDGIMKQYQLRKEKALARLSPKDIEFMDTKRKELAAYKHISGIVWDYQECNQDQVSGFLFDPITKRNRYFCVKPEQLWQLIEHFFC